MAVLVGKPPGRGALAWLLALVCLPAAPPAPAQDDPLHSFAAAPPDTVLQSKAEVAIAADQQMDFGQIADKDGSVVLGLNDSITADPDLIHYGGSPYSAICTITGDPSSAVDVSIASVGANGLSLSAFQSGEGALPLIGVLLDEAGELVLTLGATLTVDSALASIGTGQSISYTVTSTYN